MILLIGVLGGLLAAALRLQWRGGRLDLPEWRSIWLVPLAFLPQWIVFESPLNAHREIPLGIAGAVLVGSQCILLAFIWTNRDKAGFWLLGLGAGLNLLVIALNGGLMPISPETVTRIAPWAPEGAWQLGTRLGTSKDIVLLPEQMRLGLLSDRFLIPAWIPYRAAFSLGDAFIALGAFRTTWSLGGGKEGAWMVPKGVSYEAG